MKAWRLALAAAAAGLAGCGSMTPTETPADRELSMERRGMLGDLRWNIDLKDRWEAARLSEPVNESERAEFKKWRDSLTPSERQEFEDWRAWQEWKRKNPK